MVRDAAALIRSKVQSARTVFGSVADGVCPWPEPGKMVTLSYKAAREFTSETRANTGYARHGAVKISRA